TKLAGEVEVDLSAYLESTRGTRVPWSEARIFQSKIRRNVKLAEAPSYGQTIFDYAPRSNGATDYLDLADELLAILYPPPPAPAAPPEATSVSLPADRILPAVETEAALPPTVPVVEGAALTASPSV